MELYAWLHYMLEDDEEVIEENVHEIEKDEESPGIPDPVEALLFSGPTSSKNSNCCRETVREEREY